MSGDHAATNTRRRHHRAILTRYAGNVSEPLAHMAFLTSVSCAACYKDKSTYTKPLAQVLDEVALSAW